MKIDLFNDDCLNILKTLPDNSVDFVLTDPPYGILSNKKEADYQNENRNFCDWDFELPYDEVLPELKRVIKDACPVALFAKAPFTFRLHEEMTKHGFKFLYNWIWKKSSCPNFASMKFRPGNNYEEVMIFSKGNKRINYYPHAEFNGEVKTKCKFYDYKTRTPIPSEEVFDKYLIPYFFQNFPIGDECRLTYSTSRLAYEKNGNYKKGNDDKGGRLASLFNEDVRISSAGGESTYSHTGKGGKKLPEIFNEDIKISAREAGANSNVGFAGKGLKEILNEDVRISSAGETAESNSGKQGVKLTEVLNEDIVIGRPNPANVLQGGHFQFSNLFKEKYRDQFEIDFENKELYRTVKTYRNFPTAVIDIKYGNSVNKKWKKHPTTKPVEVLEFLLNHYTNEGDNVLDFTMGSGSTGVACKNLNRNFIGIEISKTWYDVAQLRINDV